MMGPSPSAERRGSAFSALPREDAGSKLHALQQGPQQARPPRASGPRCCCTARAVGHSTHVRSGPDSPAPPGGRSASQPRPVPLSRMGSFWPPGSPPSLPPAPGARCVCVGPTWCWPPGFSAQGVRSLPLTCRTAVGAWSLLLMSGLWALTCPLGAPLASRNPQIGESYSDWLKWEAAGPACTFWFCLYWTLH